MKHIQLHHPEDQRKGVCRPPDEKVHPLHGKNQGRQNQPIKFIEDVDEGEI